jgi:hypothetical protein
MKIDPTPGWQALPKLLDQCTERGVDGAVRAEYRCSLAELVVHWVSNMEPRAINSQTIARGAQDIAEKIGMPEARDQLERLILCHMGLELHGREARGTGGLVPWSHHVVLSRFARELGPQRTPATSANTAGSSNEAGLRTALHARLDGFVELRRLLEPAAPEVVRERVANIDATRVRLAAADHSFETCADGLAPLPAEAAVALVEHKLRAEAEALTGVAPDHPDYGSKLRACSLTPTRHALLDRLTGDPERFDAFLDEANGAVLLRERLAEPLPELDATIDSRRGLELLAPMIDGPVPTLVHDSAAHILSGIVPTRALELFAKSHVSYWLVRRSCDLHPATPKFANMFGAGNAAAETFRARNRNNVGEFRSSSREALGRTSLGYPTRDMINTLVHESMHVLDHLLGENGQFMSDSGPWKKLFHETAAGNDLAFPTAYAATNEQEFFAECATMFLTTHMKARTEGPPCRVFSRSDLERLNPRAYELLEDLFLHQLPELDLDTIAQRQSTVATVREGLREAEEMYRDWTYTAIAASDAVRAQWDRGKKLVVATERSQLAHVTRDPGDRGAALGATRELLSDPDIEPNIAAICETMLADLEALA